MAELLAQRRRGGYRASNTAIAKMVQTSDNFGNRGIKKQQISHRHLYHYLPLTLVSSQPLTYNFFENVNTAAPLFSNITENKLQIGESMVIKHIFFDIMFMSAVTDLNPVSLMSDEMDFRTAGLPQFYMSQMQWLNDNNRVIKPLGLQEMNPMFNKTAFNDKMNVITLKSDITLQPLLTFVGQLLTPAVNISLPLGVGSIWIGMHCLGEGTILSPKKNF